MSDGIVHKWVRDGRKNVHDEERSGRPSAIRGNLLQKVDEKVKMKQCFTISSLSGEFPQIPRSVLYEIVSKRVAAAVTSGGKFL